ncbi:MAG: hypothetical protein ABT18_09835 [Rhodanobacter sp. SCN 66-43]|nr:MAG: hypothetical protein ABT18_09835 [Rhodanobacter sp. SCN 66-43]
MGDMTIKQLALMLGTPVDVLVPQLTEAGVVFEGISDTIDREGKLKLLDYLRQRFARQKEPRKASVEPVTLKRRKVVEVPVPVQKPVALAGDNMIDVLKRVADATGPMRKAIHATEAEKEELERKLALANEYSCRLLEATTKLQRARIHAECGQEEILGDEKPGRVIAHCKRKLEDVERILKSQRRELQVRASEAARQIRHVMVDASNLCFQRGKIIGIEPLADLLEKLKRKGIPATPCFDSNTLVRIHLTKRALVSKLKPHLSEGVDLIVSDREADEYVLLSEQPGTYFISRDRYINHNDLKQKIPAAKFLECRLVNGIFVVPGLRIGAAGA